MTLTPKYVTQLKPVALWALPPLISLVLYWPGLTCWFQKDDFVWLSLRGMVHNWQELQWALFAPLAQGTVRTLSERIFFMSFYSLFGLDALPYRCVVFLTGIATVTLLSSVCYKLTGFRAAGFWAAILWTVNSTTAFVFSWTAIYHQLLCAFFLLLDLWLLIRYVETGRRRFYVAQCFTFVLGFSVLELNVVYPALALTYALCCARHIIGKVISLFLISAAYTALHITAAALPSSGPYKMFWDGSMLSSFWTYWKFALGPNRLIYLGIYPSFSRSALTIVLMIGLLGFLFSKLRQREWLAAFFPAWFVIALSPLLPLRDHINESYLTIPLIGLAMWAGWGLVSGFQAGRLGRIASLVLLVVYLCVSVPVARVNVASFADRSHAIHKLMLGVVAVSRSQPGKLIFLKGVDEDIFWSAIYFKPFRLFGIDGVYLVPDAKPMIDAGPQLGNTEEFFLTPVKVREALDQGQALVCDVVGGLIRDITSEYRPPATSN